MEGQEICSGVVAIDAQDGGRQRDYQAAFAAMGELRWPCAIETAFMSSDGLTFLVL